MMKKLLLVAVFGLFALSASAFAKDAKFYCIDKKLMNAKADTIYEFMYPFQCDASLRTIVKNTICSEKTLLNHKGTKIVVFDYEFQCTNAQSTFRNGMFCADKRLFSTQGKLVQTFDYDFQCQNALNQMPE